MEHEENGRRPASISVPSRMDPLLRRLTEGVGGPLGKHAAPGRVRSWPFPVGRVLVLLTTTAALLAVLVKNPCRVDGWVRPEQFYRACYSDWSEAFQFQGLGRGSFPIFDDASTYDEPALQALFAGIVSLLIPASDPVRAEPVVQFFDVNAVLITAAWVGTVIATLRLASRRPWDAAIVAVAPIAIFTATSSWTMVAVLLGVLGSLAFAKDRFVLAGVLLGIGAGFSVHVLLIYGAVVLLTVRTGLWRPSLFTGVGLAVTWILTALSLGTGAPSWEYDPARIDVSSSVWASYNLLAERVGAPVLATEAVGVAAVVGFLALSVLVVLLVLRAPRRPRLPQVAFLLVGALVLVLPDYRPAFTLWLLPLLALSYVDWRMFIGWQVVEVLHWWAYWLFIAREASSGAVENNIDSPFYAAAILARVGVTAYLMYRVAEHMLQPAFDPVRRFDIDDPAGGPFNGAPDRARSAPVGLEPSAPTPNTGPKDPT
ncbi:phage shock protein PspC (stress-responsive transcriptional regulator) [Arthrobacter pigmenti]|uniref:Phage shock protein PspC (Stress-responsive transcriptional regulator) n=1 Tax=Arthrobacter pigmenti TaxID=271432 RepID=A0A846S160_9MICC|nr:hypothetical protein [Arthrobacter pigmenti]NJC24171.1 phage shock protein PspC (stress-responsive transcriptional regulator) [Arthrobacter pigmenti]